MTVCHRRTEYAIAEHWRPIWWLRRSAASVPPYVERLVAEGTLARLAVADGRAPVLVEAGVELDRPRPSAAVLLSPFDNLLWETRFGQRVLGFEHVIEVQTGAAAPLRLLRPALPVARSDRRAPI